MSALLPGALFIKVAMGLEGEAGLYSSILVLLAIAAIFTIGGGLSAVMWTDFVQVLPHCSTCPAASV